MSVRPFCRYSGGRPSAEDLRPACAASRARLPSHPAPANVSKHRKHYEQSQPKPARPLPQEQQRKDKREETNRTPTAHRVHALLDDDAERLGRHRAVPPTHVHVADLGVVGEVRERDRVDVAHRRVLVVPHSRDVRPDVQPAGAQRRERCQHGSARVRVGRSSQREERVVVDYNEWK